MTKEAKTNFSIGQDSLAGAMRLKPAEMNNSLSGASSLKPSEAKQTSQTTQQKQADKK